MYVKGLVTITRIKVKAVGSDARYRRHALRVERPETYAIWNTGVEPGDNGLDPWSGTVENWRRAGRPGWLASVRSAATFQREPDPFSETQAKALRCPSAASASCEIFDRRDVKRCDGVNVTVSIDHRDGVSPDHDEFWMRHFEFAAVGSADDEGLKAADHSLADYLQVHVENLCPEIR
jgi:hypothetical protein